jgi:serine protease Do
MNRFARFYLPALILVCSIVGASAFLQNASSQTQAQLIPAPPGQSTVTPPQTKSSQKAEQDLKTQIPLDPMKMGDPLPRNLFVELSKLINPTVVSITTTSMPHANQQRYRDPLQDFLDEFWGNRGGAGGGADGSGRARPRQQAVQALGTGFIVREDGLIITNNHVVAEADIIKVQLDSTSDKFYEATIVGRDDRTDIALIKIDAKRPLPYARLGTSKDVQVGEWVAAFGNPYGHAHTMTKGIISAIGREIAEINRFPFIQTDASINPGNSGGPLVNTQGLVIGVNTAIDARAQGIGFAIPIDNVKQIVGILEKEGRIRRGYLGVNIGALDENIASQLGMDEPTGAVVAQVMEGSPAAKAGLQTYDIIVDVNGKKIGSPGELQNAIAELTIGSKAKVHFWRFNAQGKRSDRTVSITITKQRLDRSQSNISVKKRLLISALRSLIGMKV